MKNVIAIMTIILLSIPLQAKDVRKIPIQSTNNIDNYISDFNTSRTNFHRSGLYAAGKVDSFDLEQEEQTSIHWRTKRLSEHKVILNKFADAMDRKIEQIALKHKLTFSSKIENKSHIKCEKLNPENEQRSELLKYSHNKTLDILTLNGRDYAGKELRQFKGELEYSNAEEIRFNDTLIILKLRYRRIFDGGIILGDLSNVTLSFSSDGDLIGIEAKWPTFVKVKVEESTIDLITAFQTAQTAYSVWGEEEFNNKLIEPSSVEIQGVANAWENIMDNGEIIISPCLSVAGRILFVNGEFSDKFIQIPRCAKYIANN